MAKIKGLTLEHWLKNVCLIALSFIFLPIDTLVVMGRLAINLCLSNSHYQRQGASDKRRTVLVTGVGMSKGLVLARSFYLGGWTVIGADFSPLACGRFSKSLTKYYTVANPGGKTGSTRYLNDLLQIVSRHDIDLWVSCSSVASAVEDGEAKEVIESQTSCKAVQFDAKTTQVLHEKHTFLERAANYGLSIPDTHHVISQDDVEAALSRAPPNRKYIMKPIGVDDANRGDLTLISKANWTDKKTYISQIPMSKDSPWILQQFVDGPEYCTHALVVRGYVKAFVACASAELLMHYAALPSQSEAYHAMLQFTRAFAAKEGTSFTGHLSFDFMAGREDIVDGERVVLYPIECNPRAHTAVVLFQDQPELVAAYSSYLESAEVKHERANPLVTPRVSRPTYWMGHDLIELLLQPMWELLLGRPTTSLKSYLRNVKTLIMRSIHWHDGTYVNWDPAPWWWLYHVYWPWQFFNSVVLKKKWSRINVSTTKMFTLAAQ